MEITKMSNCYVVGIYLEKEARWMEIITHCKNEERAQFLALEQVKEDDDVVVLVDGQVSLVNIDDNINGVIVSVTEVESKDIMTIQKYFQNQNGEIEVDTEMCFLGESETVH